MPYADINGQRLYYEDTGGSGPPVIFAHGFLMDQSMFDPQVAALSSEFRIIRWDARAFGRTEWDGRPFSLWDSAADCIGLLDHLRIERAVVGGMSQGGFVALRVALTRPDRVKALVLMSTSAIADPEEAKAGQRQMGEHWGPVDALLEPLAGMILGARDTWEPWITNWKQISKERVLGAMNALMNREDVRSRLGEITCPVLVIHGDADRGISIEQGEHLAQNLSGAKGLVRVEGAAHAPSLTHAAIVNPPLLDFLRAHA